MPEARRGSALGLAMGWPILSLFVGGCSNGSNDDAAPDFKLMALDGREVSVSDFKGKVVLINFWAVGCMPCRIELPHLKELHEKHKGELVILAVNAWDEPPELVKESPAEKVLTVLTGARVFRIVGRRHPHGCAGRPRGQYCFSPHRHR
jgi:thiol-disulfide isomerase/thioredoxin